ncbi:MAG: hypothetical protein BWY46_00362 [Firmicutes bacterium ADurb.Bin300]|nr:MAG: hypothetical protein BWY46_00362 [Firmicutes bacterium ADurb.Bin300]
MNLILSKLKEVVLSVLPITLIVVLLNFTLTPLETPYFIRFLIAAALIIIGLTVFLLGVDLGITPIGVDLGQSVAKSNRIWMVALAGILLGFFINIAEPDLHVLAGQVQSVTSALISKQLILIVVSVGIAVMLSLGLIRIVKYVPLNIMFTVLYAIIFFLAFFTTPEFLAISFDASGATTGALTTPFMLALALGVSRLKKDSKASEIDSFGLVGLASSGAIISVMVMSIISKPEGVAAAVATDEASTNSILLPFIQMLPTIAWEIALALMPIVIIFLISRKFSLKMSKKSFIKVLFGLIMTFTGLVIFLLGVNAGFMKVGNIVGFKFASMDSGLYVILAGFILGMVTIIAEPAVSILTHQIEDVTSGYVKRKVVMVFLALGVALAVALSIVRIVVPEIQLWHFLLPGYLLSIVMSFFTPKLFVGIAFDSGGVASGPMAATFILAFAQGAAEATESANVLIDGFGIIAMIAMTPLIALQILGFIFKIKSKKRG